jgi:hypothetical protein
VILLIILLVLLFGGGGGYYLGNSYGFPGGGFGSGFGLIIIALVILYFLGYLRH